MGKSRIKSLMELDKSFCAAHDGYPSVRAGYVLFWCVLCGWRHVIEIIIGKRAGIIDARSVAN
jgi:hypothetical protein